MNHLSDALLPPSETSTTATSQVSASSSPSIGPSVPIASATATGAVPVQGLATTEGSAAGVLLGVLLTGAVLAAVIGALVNTLLARRKSLEEERARVRTVFAEAFRAVAAYKEFPYTIRRRRHDEPESERVRISQAMSNVQADLSYYLAWTRAESDAVGRAYAALVAELRRVAGSACREAWETEPITADKDMNINGSSAIDLSAVSPFEDAFVEATQRHLSHFLSLRRLLRSRP